MSSPAPNPATDHRDQGAPARSRFALVWYALAWCMTLFFVTRLVLLVAARQELTAGPALVVKALLVGEAYDVLAASWLVAPLLLYLALLPERWFAARTNRGLVRAAFFLGAAVTVFVAAVEYF